MEVRDVNDDNDNAGYSNADRCVFCGSEKESTDCGRLAANRVTNPIKSNVAVVEGTIIGDAAGAFVVFLIVVAVTVLVAIVVGAAAGLMAVVMADVTSAATKKQRNCGYSKAKGSVFLILHRFVLAIFVEAIVVVAVVVRKPGASPHLRIALVYLMPPPWPGHLPSIPCLSKSGIVFPCGGLEDAIVC